MSATRDLARAISLGHVAETDRLMTIMEQSGDLNERIIRMGLQVSVAKGHIDILNAIVARARARNSGFLEDEDNTLRIALQTAAKHGQPDVALKLLEYGAKTDVIGPKGFPPLFLSVKRPQNSGHRKVTRLLLDKINPGCPADTEWRDSAGQTCLMFAALRGNRESLELLIEHGANVNAQDDDGLTVLHILAKSNQTQQQWTFDIVRLLLATPIDVNARDVTDRTALHYATASGKRQLVGQILLSNSRGRANVNSLTLRGKSALHLACDATAVDIEMIQLLLHHGADPGLKSDGNWTCLHFASLRGSLEAVKMLLVYRSNLLNAQTNTGQTALHLAAREEHADIVMFLLSHEEIEMQGKDNLHYTPLGRAAVRGRKDIVAMLMPANNIHRLGPHVLEACMHFNATTVDFSSDSNRLSRCRVFDLLYGKDKDGSPTVNAVIGNVQRKHSKPEPRFRWVHLPQNNKAWVHDLLTKVFMEDVSLDPHSFNTLQEHLDQHYRGPRLHSVFMKPQVKLMPRALTVASVSRGVTSAVTWDSRLLSSVSRRLSSASEGSNSVSGETTWASRHLGSASRGPVEASRRSAQASRRSASASRGSAAVPRGLASASRGSASVSRGSISNSRRTRPGSMEPQETDFDTSTDQQTRQNEIAIFMPYLSIESMEGYSRMRDALKVAQSPQGNSEPGTYEDLLLGYIANVNALQPPRSLDQFHLPGLDTEARDTDQVFTRYCRALGAEEKLLMVDQLWLWILGPKLILTASPQGWQGRRRNFDNILRSLLSEMNSQEKPRWSIYDMATQIVLRCTGLSVRYALEFEPLQCLQAFERSIEIVAAQEARCWAEFYENSKVVEAVMMGQTIEQHSTRSPIDEFLSVLHETSAYQEIKDIRDELKMLVGLLTHQKTVVSGFKDALGGLVKIPSESAKDIRERLEQINSQMEVINYEQSEIHRLNELAIVMEESILNLLNLKQRRAGALEARFARKQALDTAQQGKVIMVFTVVTIIFLPMSFMAAFFAIPTTEFSGTAGLSLAYVTRYTFGIGLGISTLLVIIAFNVDRFQRFVLRSARYWLPDHNNGQQTASASKAMERTVLATVIDSHPHSTATKVADSAEKDKHTDAVKLRTVPSGGLRTSSIASLGRPMSSSHDVEMGQMQQRRQ